MATDLFDNPVFCGLAVLFTILFLLNLRSLLKITPSLLDCMVRWKGNMELEDSIQLTRSRNWIAAILFIPFCMVVYSHGLYSPAIIESLPPILRLAGVCAAFLAYLLLRAFLNWQLEMHSYGTAVFTAANRSFYNYCIILFFLLFITGAVIKAITNDAGITRTVLLWVTAITYIIYIFRRGQIFASVCNPFSTFLYLCSLELLPTVGLILSDRLL